jgi:Xaa-Pro aminopeptidase
MLLHQERAEAALREYDLDAVIASTPENVTYLANYSPWACRVYQGILPERGRQTYAVLTRDVADGPSVITDAFGILYAASYNVSLADLWLVGPDRGTSDDVDPGREDEKRHAQMLRTANRAASMAEGLSGALIARGLRAGRIGIETFNLSPAVRSHLEEQFPNVVFLDAGHFLRYLRFVKTPDEIDRLRRAARVNEEAMQECIKELRPGVSELDVRRTFKRALGERDANYEFFQDPGGRRAGGFLPPSGYRYQSGDSLVMDGGSIMNEYHADTGVCAYFGDPPQEHRDFYQAMYNACQAGLQVLKPGVTGPEIHEAIADAQVKQGLPRGNHFGHGIGLEARDYPLIQETIPPVSDDPDQVNLKSHDLPLETGSVVNLEVPCMPGLGHPAVHIEYTLVITPSGYEEIIPYERQLLAL